MTIKFTVAQSRFVYVIRISFAPGKNCEMNRKYVQVKHAFDACDRIWNEMCQAAGPAHAHKSWNLPVPYSAKSLIPLGYVRPARSAAPE